MNYFLELFFHSSPGGEIVFKAYLQILCHLEHFFYSNTGAYHFKSNFRRNTLKVQTIGLSEKTWFNVLNCSFTIIIIS